MDWYAFDFGATHEISSIKLYLYTDDKSFIVPDTVTIEYQNGVNWIPVKIKQSKNLTGNTQSLLIRLQQLRSG